MFQLIIEFHQYLHESVDVMTAKQILSFRIKYVFKKKPFQSLLGENL